MWCFELILVSHCNSIDSKSNSNWRKSFPKRNFFVPTLPTSIDLTKNNLCTKWNSLLKNIFHESCTTYSTISQKIHCVGKFFMDHPIDSYVYLYSERPSKMKAINYMSKVKQVTNYNWPNLIWLIIQKLPIAHPLVLVKVMTIKRYDGGILGKLLFFT